MTTSPDLQFTMVNSVLLLVCATLLAGSAHTVEANQGDVKQQLKDDPRRLAIKVLEEKILAIQTGLSGLNNTVIANQKEVMRVNCNVSRNSRDISTNKNGIKTSQLPQTMKTTIPIPRSWTNLQFIHATVLTLWLTHTTPYANLSLRDLEPSAGDQIAQKPGIQPLTSGSIVASSVVSFARAQLKKLQRTHWQTHHHKQQGVRLQVSPRLSLYPYSA